MMTKGWIKNICILLVLCSTVASCKKDDDEGDVVAPTATILSPIENDTYLRGNTLYLNAEFSDDVELMECRVFLTEALKGWDETWIPEELIFPLSGTNDAIADQFLFENAIPSNIKSTNYILVVLVVDHALNYTRYELPIEIK